MSCAVAAEAPAPFPSPVRSAAVVTGATVVSLGIGFVTNLVSPAVLSKEAYGVWRAFVLYTSYAGVVHAGLVDGTVVRWAGSSLDERRLDVARSFKFFSYEQVLVVSVLTVLMLVLLPVDAALVVAAGAAVVALNFFSYIQYLLQAFRKFGHLAASTVASHVLLLAGIVLIAAAGYPTALAAVACTIFSVAVAALVGSTALLPGLTFRGVTYAEAVREGVGLIRVGAFFLIGNLLATLFFALDRLFATTIYSASAFAAYAFPTTLVASVYAVVSSVAAVAFPYLSGKPDALGAAFKLGKSITLVTWGFALALFFALQVIVESFLPAYRSSLPILRIVLLAIGAGTIIRSTHYNLYRLTVSRGMYVATSAAGVVLFGVGLAAAGHGATMETLAWTAVAATAVWFLIGEAYLMRRLHQPLVEAARQLCGGCLFGLSFWWVGHSVASPFAGATVFVVCVTAITFVLFRRDLIDAARELGWRRSG